MQRCWFSASFVTSQYTKPVVKMFYYSVNTYTFCKDIQCIYLSREECFCLCVVEPRGPCWAAQWAAEKKDNSVQDSRAQPALIKNTEEKTEHMLKVSQLLVRRGFGFLLCNTCVYRCDCTDVGEVRGFQKKKFLPTVFPLLFPPQTFPVPFFLRHFASVK